jgi:S1-C subfamily serine protease
MALLAILSAFAGFSSPAKADHPPELDQIVALLQKAQNSPAESPDSSSPNRKTLIQSALTLSKKLHGGGNYKGHKASAQTALASAIAEEEKGDPDHKVQGSIEKALSDYKTSIEFFDEAPAQASTPVPRPAQTVPSHFGNATNPGPLNPPVPAVVSNKLTTDQARAVVLIKGDNVEGTGFLVKTADGPVVVTNIHVISNNPNLKITTNTGTTITILSYKGATDRDMAMIAIKDGNYSYLTLATDISGTVQPGDEVITPGNSEGGEVMLNTDGKVLGIGPNRVEFDNPVYHGNSGGPIFHVKSGKVIGLVTEAVKVDVSDELDKASFANRNSAIGHSMRYFGLRLDTVGNWESYDWRRFQNETAFLDQFDKRNRCLDCYLNAPDDNKPEDTLWLDDDKIKKANSSFFSQTSGADISQQMDAARQWLSDMYGVANTDMDAIQEPKNFYAFGQLRAKDAIAYRKALKAELDTRSDNISQLAGMPRSNK